MIKRIQELTEEERKRFYRATMAEIQRTGHISAAEVQQKIQRLIDQAFDDELFPKMSADDRIDASFCRKEFGDKKPDIIDYLLWSGKFVTHSDYVEIPDE